MAAKIKAAFFLPIRFTISFKMGISIKFKILAACLGLITQMNNISGFRGQAAEKLAGDGAPPP
jgi:hypothetical protein